MSGPHLTVGRGVTAQLVGLAARQVRAAVAATVARLLGLHVRAVTVIVDGVGG